MQGQDVIDRIYATQVNYRSSLAALTWLLYDIFLTFEDEVKYVWPKPWSIIKAVFYFIRYVPLFVQLSILTIGSPELTPGFHFTHHACFIWQVYQVTATITIFVAVDYVLILRVYALYHNNPLIRKIVLVAFATEVVLMVTGLVLSLPTIQFDELCVVSHASTILLLYVGATLLFQTFLFSLTLIKFVRAIRDGWGDTPLVVLVMRDGSWAFVLLFAVVVGTASLYEVKNHYFAAVLFCWLLSVFSFCGYRVLLNLDRLSAAPRMPTRQTTTNQAPFEFTTQLVSEDSQLSQLHSSYYPITSASSRRSSELA
ncbi:hypothetical protein MIND_00036300 [Mycena indigotica]|uniref:DUF6533 domain-containing protein n=1 Tax=Mycena indigotica TaxID=2126181 RepID=A0A8H6WK14_9AGAR|nr:uncharacterized protein MIND_00036300 [Mycena indigotica]KAF7315219.1 hypothetical protein MIND_00036300 [Mycena indigotica]